MEKYLTIEHIQQLIAKLTTLGTEFGVKLITAIAIFIIGRWVAIGLKNLIDTAMRKAKMDEALISFTVHLSYIAMIAFAVIAALGQLGIQTTSFIAVLSAAGLAVGLALQGSLSNFAAGVLMLIFRPFLDLIKADKGLLENPAPQIVVGEAGNGRVNILYRPWTKADDYWNAYLYMMETVKKRFDAENIKPPVPLQDIHLFQQA